MNGIKIFTSNHNKLLCFHRKFTSSAALLESPIESAGKCNELGPLHFLSNPREMRGSALSETKLAHALLLKSRVLYSNIYAANNLISAYSECSHMDCAFKLFDEIPDRNLVTWNLMILGCNKNFLFDISWSVFRQMHKAGVGMDEFTYGTTLSACNALEHVKRGEQIYGLVAKNGFFSNGYVRTGMIDLFSRCRMTDDALKVLYENHCENVVCWNAVVSGAVKNKDNWLALEIFSQMCRHSSVIPNAFTFSSVLTACAAVEELNLGRNIHGCVIKSGVGSDIFVGTSILDFYAKSGAMCDAIKQFRQMPIRNVVSYTAMISGFVKEGDSDSAVRILNDMRKTGQEINSYTISSVLAACANPAMFTEALQIHCWIFKNGLYSNPVVKASLINTYSKAGAVNLSEKAFAETRGVKQVGIWANMISAFVQSECYEKAIALFRRMLREGIVPDKFSFSSLLSIIDSLSLGRQVHGCTIKAGVVAEVSVGSSIVTMYSKCGDLNESLKAFENLEKKDNVSWTSMISGFSEHGFPDKAVDLFREMIVFQEKPVFDEKVLASVINACSSFHALDSGKEIHGFSIRCGFFEQATIDEALVNFYVKCDDLDSARIIFHKMPFKGSISWSSLVSGYSQRGLIMEAFRLFQEMLLSDIQVDAFTISSVIGSFTISNQKSDFGTQLHAYIAKIGLESEASVGSSLVMMYSKRGSIDDCDKVFRQIINPDLFSWTTMIASYANHGKGSKALQLFDLMKESGIFPDDVTFVGVLSACSHTGLVEDGYFHLNSMIREYKIEPNIKHYACMVDILGRAGRLDEAKRFITEMPLEPDALVWETLLAFCRVHGNWGIGKMAAEEIMKLRGFDEGVSISVSNIFAEVGEWEGVEKIRVSMEESGVKKKEPGWSFV
ncbi:hypothetical protein ACP275_09G040000 [Erythranthe tilingii]